MTIRTQTTKMAVMTTAKILIPDTNVINNAVANIPLNSTLLKCERESYFVDELLYKLFFMFDPKESVLVKVNFILIKDAAPVNVADLIHIQSFQHGNMNCPFHLFVNPILDLQADENKDINYNFAKRYFTMKPNFLAKTRSIDTMPREGMERLSFGRSSDREMRVVDTEEFGWCIFEDTDKKGSYRCLYQERYECISVKGA